MKPLVIFLTVFLTNGVVQADALLNAMLGIYPYNKVEVEKVISYSYYDDYIDYEYGNNSEYYTDDGYGEVFEFEDYHLCQYCNTEIIILDVHGNKISR